MTTVNTGSNGRQERGRFAPGNRFASGNPNHKRMYELRAALLETATAARVQAVVAKLADLAEAGDIAAAKLFLEYAVGKPVQAIAISGGDGHPIEASDEVLDRAAARVDAWRKAMTARLAPPLSSQGTPPGSGETPGAERP
jgi:hypothetical protein